MKTLSLKGTLRTGMGKQSSHNLRNEGWVPCELYGKSGNTHFKVYYADFKHLIYSPDTFKVTLDIDGKKADAILKEIQFHPLSDDLVHVDFMEVNDNSKIKVGLPIHFTGNSIGVKEGGKLVKKLRKLNVKGLVKNMPDHIEVDITDLHLGKTIKVGEIKVSSVEIVNAASNPVASVEVPRGLKDKEAEAAAAPAAKK